MTGIRLFSLAILTTLCRTALSAVATITSPVYVDASREPIREILKKIAITLRDDEIGNKKIQEIVDKVGHYRARKHSREKTDVLVAPGIRLHIVPRCDIIPENKVDDFKRFLKNQEAGITRALGDPGNGLIIIGMAISYIHEELFKNDKGMIFESPDCWKASHLIFAFLHVRDPIDAFMNGLEGRFTGVKFNTDPKIMTTLNEIATKSANSPEMEIDLSSITDTDIWLQAHKSVSIAKFNAIISKFLDDHRIKFNGQPEIYVTCIEVHTEYSYDLRAKDSPLKYKSEESGPMLLSAKFPPGFSKSAIKELADGLKKAYSIEAIPDEFAMKVAGLEAKDHDMSAYNISEPVVRRPKYGRIIAFNVEGFEYNVHNFLKTNKEFLGKTISEFPKHPTNSEVPVGAELKMFRNRATNSTNYMLVLTFIMKYEPDMQYLQIKTDIKVGLWALSQLCNYAKLGDAGLPFGQQMPEPPQRAELPLNQSDPRFAEIMKGVLTGIAEVLAKDPNICLAISIETDEKSGNEKFDRRYIGVIYQHCLPKPLHYVIPMINDETDSEENNLQTKFATETKAIDETELKETDLHAEDFTDPAAITPVLINRMLKCLFKVRGFSKESDSNYAEEFHKANQDNMKTAQGVADVIVVDETPDEGKYFAELTMDVNLSDTLKSVFEFMKKSYPMFSCEKITGVGFRVKLSGLGDNTGTALLIY